MKVPIRIIPRIDVRGKNVVKGIHLEGVRKVGLPNELALKYTNQGADEILFMDVVASLYGRDNDLSVVREAAKNIFIPLTVGGGIRTIEDIVSILRNGADKVAINTAAIERPGFLYEASHSLGSQCIIVSVEAKKIGPDQWEAFTHNGREKTGLDVIEWAREAQHLGAGEILVTSVDQEGTMNGFDIGLVEAIFHSVTIPVIACGGAGTIQHVISLADRCPVDAVCCASIFHFDKAPLDHLKNKLHLEGIPVRQCLSL